MESPLTLMLAAPLVGLAVLLVLPPTAQRPARWLAATAALLPVLLAGWVLTGLSRGAATFAFTERIPWIPVLEIEFILGVDGVSALLAAGASLVTFIAVWTSLRATTPSRTEPALLLLLGVALSGVFVALDLVLFLLFWQLALLPASFLILRSGREPALRAASRAFLHGVTGGACILIAILALYFATDPFTFDMTEIAAAQHQYPHSLQYVVWLLVFVGFAIQIPVVPLHTWLGDTVDTAPAPSAALVAAVVPTVGAYGIWRIGFGFLPEATADLAFLCLAVLGTMQILYGSLCALGATRLRRLVAYCCIAHMGFVLLGMATLTPAGGSGVLLLLVGHFAATALALLVVGHIVERHGEDDIARLHGALRSTPRLAAFASLGLLAVIGVPGFAVFMGKFFVLHGAWERHPELALLALAGMLLTAAVVAWRLFPLISMARDDEATVADLSWPDMVPLAPLAILVVGIGVYPQPVLTLVEAPVRQVQQAILPFL